MMRSTMHSILPGKLQPVSDQRAGRLTLLLFALALLAVSPVYPQQGEEETLLPRVGLLSATAGQGRTASVLGSVVEDTIELALLQLGEYEFVPSQELREEVEESRGGESGGGEDELRSDPVAAAVAAGKNLEFLLLQRIIEGEEESSVSIEVYDAVRGEIRGAYSGRFRSTLDVFDAADEAILGALGELAGAEVAFGSLRIEPRGAVRPYTLSLGEALYTDSPRSLTRLLTGNYPYEALTEEGYLILQGEVEVRERSATTVSLSFPELFPEELRRIREQYRRGIEAAIEELAGGGAGSVAGGEATAEADGTDNGGAEGALPSTPDIPGVRGVARGAEHLGALRRGEAPAGGIDRNAVEYRELPAAELHERITSIGRSTVGTLESLARRVTIPEDQSVTIDGDSGDWEGRSSFFREPPVEWISRADFADHTGQLMMLFEFSDPELLTGSITNFTLIFSGTEGRELSLEFRSDQDTADVGTATWNMRGAYLAAGERVLEIAVPKNAFARLFEPAEQLRVRLKAEPVTAAGTVPLRDTGFQGALMPLLE